MDSKISQQEAALATKQILDLYDTIPAANPKAFAAGLVATLLIFPRPVIERAVDPVNGIAAKVSYLNLAKIREQLDIWRAEYLDHQERLERACRKILPAPASDDPEAKKRVSEGFKKLSDHLGKGFGPSSI